MTWFCILMILVGCALAPIRKKDITPTETKYLPRSPAEYKALTKDFDCPDGTYPHYVISSTAKKTYIVCWERRRVFGYCLEYNEGGQIVQPNVLTNCTKYPLSPCGSTYISTDSYKIFECFEKYGGMLSPMQQTKNLQDCKEDLEIITIQRNVSFGVIVVVITAILIFFVTCGLRTRCRNSGLRLKTNDEENDKISKEDSDEDEELTHSATDSKAKSADPAENVSLREGMHINAFADLSTRSRIRLTNEQALQDETTGV